MSESEVAVVVAAAAGVASLIVAAITVVGARGNEARSAHRSILGPYLEDLGLNITGVVATCRVFLRRIESGQDLAPWRRRMEAHGSKLNELRKKVRYPLYGTEDGLRVLSRVGSWTQHYQGRVADGYELIEAADGLRLCLDRVIAKSYRRGEPPSRLDRRRITKSSSRVEQLWKTRMGESVPDE